MKKVIYLLNPVLGNKSKTIHPTNKTVTKREKRIIVNFLKKRKRLK